MKKGILIGTMVLAVVIFGIAFIYFLTRSDGEEKAVSNIDSAITTAGTEPLLSQADANAITVHNGSELLSNLKSDATLILAPGDYDMNALTHSMKGNPYISDGFIYNLKNVVLIGRGKTPIDFTTKETSSPVLAFKNCDNITVTNLNLGHKPPAGAEECTGSVVQVQNCNNVKIQKCILFGCGKEGLTLNDVDRLEFSDSIVKECSQGFATISKCKNISFIGSKFLDNAGGVYTEENHNVKFTNCQIVGREYTPDFSDQYQYYVLTNKGTITEKMYSVVLAYINHMKDSISNTEIKNVWLSSQDFPTRFRQLNDGIMNGFGKNLLSLRYKTVEKDNFSDFTLQLEVKMPSDITKFTLDKIGPQIKKLSKIKSFLKESGIIDVNISFIDKGKEVINVNIAIGDLIDYLPKDRNDIPKGTQVTMLDSKSNISAFLKSKDRYLSGDQAVAEIGKLMDIKQEAAGEEYANGVFQSIRYDGVRISEGKPYHMARLEQVQPLLGDYLHYSYFAYFKVDAATGVVYEVNDITGESKVKRVPADIRSFLLEASKIQFNYQVSKNDIAEKDGNKMFAISGNCDTVEKVEALLGKYFKKPAYDAELHKRKLTVTEEFVRFIETGFGEENIDDRYSLMLLLKDEPDRKIVKVQLFGREGSGSCAIYTLERSGSSWIIADEKILDLNTV